jgi:omega-amidase
MTEATAPATETLRLALVQFDQVFEDKAANRATIERLLPDAGAHDLVVLPEMTLTGFSMDPSRTTLLPNDLEGFSSLARRLRSGVVFCGVEDGRNVAVLLDREGRRVGVYAKRHLFGLGGEPEAYDPGTSREIWSFEGWRILPAICYDLRFSYHFWDRAADLDLVIVPANWPRGRALHWRTLLAARAIENQVFVAGCNRIGSDPKLSYAGDSLVAGPLGQILTDGGDREGVHPCELSRADLLAARTRFPFLADRVRERT